MDAPLQEAHNQAKFSATLSLHIRQAYDKFMAACTIAYNGGIFVIDRTLILWCFANFEHQGRFFHSLASDEKMIVLDSKNKPIAVNLHEFLSKIVETYTVALEAYHSEYQALVKSRTVKKVVQAPDV